MKVGDLVKKVNHHNVDYLHNLVGLIVEMEPYRTDNLIEPLMRPIRVKWPGDYGTFWTMRQNIEVISESR